MGNRLAKPNNAYGRLYKRVQNNKNLKKDTNITFYKPVGLTTLLYVSGSWVTCRRHLHLVECQRCLRTILNTHWSDVTANIEILEMVTNSEAMLLNTASLGRTCLQDERPSPTKDRPIWRTVHWPL